MLLAPNPYQEEVFVQVGIKVFANTLDAVTQDNKDILKAPGSMQEIKDINQSSAVLLTNKLIKKIQEA